MTNTTDPARDWSAVASAWDATVEEVDLLSFDATAALFDRVAVKPGDRVLELAAGPGTLGATWSQLVGPSGAVVLSDIAPGMVETARRRNAVLDNVEVTVLDVSEIDRPDGSFDVVACRMGLMFTPDPPAALAEIRRVLAAAGRVGALTWAGMEHNPWMTCVGMAAMMNGLVSGGPPVGPGSIFSLSNPVSSSRWSRAPDSLMSRSRSSRSTSSPTTSTPTSTGSARWPDRSPRRSRRRPQNNTPPYAVPPQNSQRNTSPATA